jgi:hypothetical protein
VYDVQCSIQGVCDARGLMVHVRNL